VTGADLADIQLVDRIVEFDFSQFPLPLHRSRSLLSAECKQDFVYGAVVADQNARSAIFDVPVGVKAYQQACFYAEKEIKGKGFKSSLKLPRILSVDRFAVYDMDVGIKLVQLLVPLNMRAPPTALIRRQRSRRCTFLSSTTKR
jgi:hypothetical protein